MTDAKEAQMTDGTSGLNPWVAYRQTPQAVRCAVAVVAWSGVEQEPDSAQADWGLI